MTITPEKHFGCPGELVEFVCDTQESTVIKLSSNEYVGEHGEQLAFHYFWGNGTTMYSPVVPSTSATFINDDCRDFMSCNLSLVIHIYIKGNIHVLQSNISCHSDNMSFNATIIRNSKIHTYMYIQVCVHACMSYNINFTAYNYSPCLCRDVM